MRLSLTVVLLGMVPAVARAAPYTVKAIYEPDSGTSGKEVSLVLHGGDLIPDGGENYHLDRIVAELSKDAGSQLALSAFSRLDVFSNPNRQAQPPPSHDKNSTEQAEEPDLQYTLDSKNIDALPDRQADLLVWAQYTATPHPVVAVPIRIEPVLSRDFLCSQELAAIEGGVATQDSKNVQNFDIYYSDEHDNLPKTVATAKATVTGFMAAKNFEEALNTLNALVDELGRAAASPDQIERVAVAIGKIKDAKEAAEAADVTGKSGSAQASANTKLDMAKSAVADLVSPAATSSEVTLEAKEAQPKPAAAPAIPVLGTWNKRPFLVTDSSTPILYSFCAQRQIDWNALFAKKPPKDATAQSPYGPLIGDAQTADELKKNHEIALLKYLTKALATKIPTTGKVLVARSDDEIVLHDDISFSVLKSFGAFLFYEESSSERIKMANVLDDQSRVYVALNRDVCVQLPAGRAFAEPFHFEVQTRDGKSNPTRITAGYEHGCARQLPEKWSDRVDHDISLRVVYSIPGADDMVLFSFDTTVRHLGVIWKIPAVTEIVAAVQKNSPGDPQSNSAIPISWAIGDQASPKDPGDKGSHVAVTFPFSLSFNFRDLPDMSSYVAVFAGVSILSTDDGPKIAIGPGLALGQAFYFSYAWRENGDRFWLVGVNVPDLYPLLSSAFK